MINNFSQGQTLPPPFAVHVDAAATASSGTYDCLQHYAASVVERLLGVKIGVANNVSHALLDKR